MKKFGLLSIVFSLLLFVYGCDTPDNNSRNMWDDIWYTKCTTEQKNAQACNLDLYPVCGDNWVTYDNECFACASNEIVWYVSWPCVANCDTDGEEWMCSANISNTDNSPTQEIWLELIVTDENE